MAVDPAFKNIPKGQSGFYCWRIENMKVVSVPKAQFGHFYRGDSYIVLCLSEHRQRRTCTMKVRDVKGSLDAHIHFWLGSETTQDEAGVAAIKTVELDDFLGGFPVQHREVEEHESQLFMSYFKDKGGIKYCDGGVKSGFTHVEHVIKKRLLHCKGKQFVRIKEVPIEWQSINHGDAFILDLGNILFVWLGSDCSRRERMKAMEHARQLRDDRGSANIVPVDDGEENKMTDDEKTIFGANLPLDRKDVKSKEEGGDDESASRKATSELKLYLCTDEGGTLKVTEIKTGPLFKKDLNTKDSYIVDNGAAGIWAWNGKQASSEERRQAMRNALGFIKKKNLPATTSVTKVCEGGEPRDFKCLFKNWPEPVASGKVYTKNRIAKTVQTKFDASTLHQNRALAAETQMFDDGSGKAEIWQVVDFDLKPVNQKTIGQFYGGDCYVIKYTYFVNNKENYVIYFWQGAKSTTDEKGTSALKAKEMDDALGGVAVQVRVVMGKEPPHFMSIFDGKMIIFMGGKAGWGQKNDEGPGDSYMLQVRGTSQLTCRAVQVDMDATSLNSNDVFVVFTKTAVYIWAGKGCTGDEREMAKKVASLSPREPQMVFEGQEKDNFWTVLGGKKPYASEKRLQEVDQVHEPRLFQVSNASGRMLCQEIPDFSQQDLVPDDVMILDAWDTVYIWVGQESRQEEQASAQTIAQEYVETDPAGRDKDTPIYITKQGYEPSTFTGFFGVWDREMWECGKTYDQLKKELGEGNQALTLVKDQAMTNGNKGFNEVAKYSLEELQLPSDQLPAGIDPANKEIHLSEDDFQRLFKMNYADFVGKPSWKQKDLKKQYKLF